MSLFEYERSKAELDMLKSMDIETLEAAGVDMVELEKAMNRQGLTQKEVQVQGPHGTFTRKQWVSTGDSGGDGKSGGQKPNRTAELQNEHKDINKVHAKVDEVVKRGKVSVLSGAMASRMVEEGAKKGHKLEANTSNQGGWTVTHKKSK